jgi:hypothetical protein
MSIHAFPAPVVLPVVQAARDLVASGASVGVASVGSSSGTGNAANAAGDLHWSDGGAPPW